MNKLGFFVAAAALFGLTNTVARFGAVSGALVMVAIAVSFAVLASGEFVALAVAGGALGAFAGNFLAAYSPFASGALLVALCFAERTTRVRGRYARIVHVGASLLGGGIAGVLAAAFESSSLTVHGVATIVSAVLVSLPLLVEADDPVAHALDAAANEIGGPIEPTLREGAELRRHTDASVLDRTEAKRVNKTWASLLRLTESRLRLTRTQLSRGVDLRTAFAVAPVGAAPAPVVATGPVIVATPAVAAPAPVALGAAEASVEGSVEGVAAEAPANANAGASSPATLEAPDPPPAPLPARPVSPAAAVMSMLDQRIADHVAALSRAYTAVSAARAAAVGLDDADLKHVEAVGESLDNVSRAMLEVK